MLILFLGCCNCVVVGDNANISEAHAASIFSV